MKKEKKDNKILLGIGILNWDRGERVSDRYGFVKLFTSVGIEETLLFDEDHKDRKGRLVAKVIETRKSDHIGDLFHGVFPVTPDVGESIILGEGMLAVDDDAVGLKPEDGRESMWLDIWKLYRAHLQTVELYFEYE